MFSITNATKDRWSEHAEEEQGASDTISAQEVDEELGFHPPRTIMARVPRLASAVTITNEIEAMARGS